MSLSANGELLGLLETLCEETITDEQFARLQELLDNAPEAQCVYVEYMAFAADLRRTVSACSDPIAAPSGDIESLEPVGEPEPHTAADSGEQAGLSASDETPWEINARQEAIRTHAERLFEQFRVKEAQRQQELAYRQYRAQRRKLFIGMGSLAALLILVFAAWLLGPDPQLPEPETPPAPPAPPPVVARIIRSLNAQWAQEGLSTAPGTEFTPSAMSLTEGLVELAFEGGTDVIIQAPADLRLEGIDQMFLRGGAISARITEGSSGFIVRTPTGTVVDYGTEFGVIVNGHGETEALVYEGKVGLRSGSDPVRSVASKMLEEGQAGAVNTAGKVVSKAFRPRQVIREIPEEAGFGIPGKRFDLTDALVGGNGFGTGDANQKIDTRSAAVSSIRANSANPKIKGTGGAPARTLRFVDYFFVPDPDSGPVSVSSEGHQFADCPRTNGYAYLYLTNGGFLRHLPGIVGEQILGGRLYGARTEPVISMHANIGVTFDLQAIRNSLPGARIERFTALCGISKTAGIAKQRESGGSVQHRADFWVLVDGQARFSHQRVQIQSGAAPVDIELKDNDRFLSLVVTDGGDNDGFDWGGFALPALELAQDDRASQ